METLRRVPMPIWIAFGGIVLLLCIAGLSVVARPRSALCARGKSTAIELVGSAARLVQQATQDVDARQRDCDIDTATAYLTAARILASDADLEKMSGFKVLELHAAIRALRV